VTKRATAVRGTKYEPPARASEPIAVDNTESREPLVDARIRPLLERYVAAAGAELIDVGDGLVELQIPKADRKAFRDRAEIRIAFTLDAFERDPDAEIAVVGSPLVEQLVAAIRERGSRAFYGSIAAELAPAAQASSLGIPVTNATVSVPKVDVARHRIVRLLARVVVRAGSAVEEHLLESGFFDATTGFAVPADVTERLAGTGANEDGASSLTTDRAIDAPLATLRSSAELVSLALADLRLALEPHVMKLRGEAQRALQSELYRLDGYYSQLLSDSPARGSDASEDTARRVIEAEHMRRRAEEERRHQVRAVVHPVQLSEWELLVQRAKWKLEDKNGNRASLVAERWLNGAGAWVLACPHCGAKSPKALSMCKSGHIACDGCAQTCGVCDDQFCVDHGIAACHVDGHAACAEHARTCASCSEAYCTAHESTCAEGAHPACADCVTECAICGRSVCDEHGARTAEASPRGERRLCLQCVRHCEGGTNEPVGMDEVTRCTSCDKYVCEHHGSTCAVDQTVHCSKHLRRTDRSRRLVCQEHRTHCALEPEAIFASDEAQVCAGCGEHACDRHSQVCIEDGKRFCEKDIVPLRNEPGQFACREHHAICHVDQSAYRLGQTAECPVCERATCRAHLGSCSSCGRSVCVKDINPTGRCVTCASLRETSDPSNDVIAAAATLLGIRTRPKRWKVARDGVHTVVEVDLGWTRRVVFTVPHGDSVASGSRTHSVVTGALRRRR
jgi:hypothetical protein